MKCKLGTAIRITAVVLGLLALVIGQAAMRQQIDHRRAIETVVASVRATCEEDIDTTRQLLWSETEEASHTDERIKKVMRNQIVAYRLDQVDTNELKRTARAHEIEDDEVLGHLIDPFRRGIPLPDRWLVVTYRLPVGIAADVAVRDGGKWYVASRAPSGISSAVLKHQRWDDVVMDPKALLPESQRP